MKARYLRSIRLLAECYHAFEQLSNSHIRTLDLTPAQFDIIATLGNTPGMSCKELGEKTLITKGTLTGVLSRLEAKGLITRVTSVDDRRSSIVKLTPKGEQEFERVFPLHVRFCTNRLAGYSNDDFTALEGELAKLDAHLKKVIAALPVQALHDCGQE
jgi:MarR family transcriptional regulator, 2-MHQ and catechol-resistance regulon repressor